MPSARKSFHDSCYGLCLPPCVLSDAALPAWHMWLDDLKDRNRCYKTERAISLLFNRIERENWGPIDFVQAIENGIERGYRGLFKPNNFGSMRSRELSAMQANLNALNEIMGDE